MKIQLQLATALAALLIISNTLPVCAGSDDRLPEVTVSSQSDTLVPDGSPSREGESVSSGDKTEDSSMAVPGEAPVFSAHVEYFYGPGYVVRGTFTEFLPGTSLVRPLYSLDGEVWQSCQTTWNLQWLGSETADDLKQLQNQHCLYSTDEPLADYLAGQLDRFYLKLQITLENGITYETLAAVIDRGDPQPIPEELHPVASFVSDMLICQWRPFMRYGQYQITVSANATPEDISALLPDTLPIDIQLYDGIDFAANAIVDCPVTWKPLSLSQLTAGESVTIADAAEEIIVPAGALLNTPCGTFQLNEPLGVEGDEIRLVLNAVAEDAVPTGVLACEIRGLQIAFHLKPTGATAIRAYTLSEGESDWVELPDPLLPEEVNAPSSVAGSAYTFILKNTSEPYQTYRAVENAGNEPTPFFVGLKIEGGVYDGRELILTWPGTYELPTKLPDLNGCGGNEGNAGSDNKNDSTSEGQRPGLPQDPEDEQDTQEQEPLQEPNNEQGGQVPQEQEPLQEPNGEQDRQDSQEQEPPQEPNGEQDRQDSQEQEPLQILKDEQNTLKPGLPQILEEEPKDSPQEQLRNLADGTDGHTTEKEDPYVQPAIAEAFPATIAGTENPESVPAVSAETGSPQTDRKAPLSIAIGLCIAAVAGKVMTGSTFGKISQKMMYMINRLLHLK